MEILRFDFNGSSSEFRRTPQGFLRVNARLTKTGIFNYDSSREYRSEEEVFRTDSLESIKGAPVTDLHPAEKGTDNFLTSVNAKQHIIGITEGVEHDGPYLKGSLIIFHEDAIKAIESGEQKEISLGYKCRLEPTPGSFNGESYDAIQRDIIVNHVAIGPQGWGRAGADCSIRSDTQIIKQGTSSMTETIRFDGVDIALTRDSITTLLAERKRQLEELRGRLDAMGLELEKAQAEKAALEEPSAIESKVQSRPKLVKTCRRILGEEVALEGKSDEELKHMVIKKFHSDPDLSGKDQSYLDGMFEALVATKAERNDSLSVTRQVINGNQHSTVNSGYEKWLEHSAKMWTVPLTGSAR